MLPDDAIFRRIKRLVIDRTLHHYYENKDDQLRDRLQRRLSATGLDAAGYLAVLENRDAGEWTALESEITINETFFFRFAEQFACLADTILPSLIQARAHTRSLRIWSAGCSTGAEPYSVAILLQRLLGDALGSWSVSILGTDIDEAALRIARAGEYGEWALRSLSAEERRRDFVPLDNGRRWALRPELLSMVRFEKHNLLASLETAPRAGDSFDLVLCRNVLIYFHQDTARALVRRFGAALAPDGWLLLGHAEAVGHEPDELRAVVLDGTVVWRRRLDAGPSTGSRPDAQDPGASPSAGAARRARGLARIPASAPVEMDAVAPSQPGLDVAIASVRELADSGRPVAALAACRQALDRYPLGAELFFYSALLHRAMDRDNDAEDDFRRALYLCKPFVMAHYHLGLLLNDTARPGPGRRSIAEAARIAGDMPPDAPLSCGDGMTARRLLALSRLDLSIERGS